MAAPSPLPPPNPRLTRCVGRGGEVSSADLENPDAMRPVPAGKQVGTAGSLILSPPTDLWVPGHLLGPGDRARVERER